MWEIIAVLIFNAVVCLWTMVSNRKSIVAVFIAPLMILGTYFVYDRFNDLLGYPVPMINENISVISQTFNPETKTGYLWGVVEGENEPRAFYFPLNDGNKKQMQRGQEAMSGGYSVFNKKKQYGSPDNLNLQRIKPKQNLKQRE